MRQLRFWGWIPAFCLLAFPLGVRAANTLKLASDETVKVGNAFSFPLTLTTTDEVQGVVAAFKWNGTVGQGVDLIPGAAIAGADTVVTRVEPDYMVLGVVMDSDGLDEEIILPGDDLVLATVEIECLDNTEVSDIEFADNEFATVEGGPVLENIVVVGGLSIGTLEGLLLENGKFECVPGFPRFYIDGTPEIPCPTTGEAKVLMENLGAVEGYVVALCHDPAELTLEDILVGADASVADFSDVDIEATGGTLGVVMDLLDPYTNAVIDVGEANHIATYVYSCVECPAAGEETTHQLRFCQLELGSPLKENVMVIGGLSIDPQLEDGEVTCKRIGPVCVPENLAAGNCDDGVDNDCDGLTDIQDPECIPAEQLFACGGPDGDLGNVDVSRGMAAPICFYIKNPEDEQPGTRQYDHIQGFSMALTYCCDIEVVAETLDISGTILEAIGAEYVQVQADNDPDDGDGCELIIGVLVDALPPFDQETIPPTEDLQKMGCVTFRVKDDAPCGPCCPIEFTDGVNGRGKVPIRNLISVENISQSITAFIDCGICVVDTPCFFRGDCNFSGNSGSDGSLAVDIADAATVVSFLFAPDMYKPEIPCLDACDCNDDGRIDLADAICILRYLFQQGKFPPAPGPGYRETGEPNPNNVEPTPCGDDPTPDLLDCVGGTTC